MSLFGKVPHGAAGIVLSVYFESMQRREPQHVGTCRIDAADERNYDFQKHPVERKGEAVAHFRVRLYRMGPGGESSGGEDVAASRRSIRGSVLDPTGRLSVVQDLGAPRQGGWG